MKILFATRTDGADAWFRAAGPASLMRYNGVDVEARRFRGDDPDEFDVLWLQRHCDPMSELMAREFQSKGKKVIYDVDDWLFGLPPSWDCYRDYFSRGSGEPREALGFHRRLLGLADLVTTTTWPLANKLREYNDKIKVIPNCVLWANWDMMAPLEKGVDGPVVGWFGLPYHWDTWKEIAGAVEQAVFDVNGYLSILGFPEVVHCFSEKLRARTFTQPLVSWKRFGTFRKMIKTFDVGIAYVEDTEFNRCKSPLRALQYGVAGVPVVASKCVYDSVLGCDKSNPAKYALVVDSPSALYYAIKNTIGHPDLAHFRVDAWQREVWRAYTFETQWARWLKAAEEACGA